MSLRAAKGKSISCFQEGLHHQRKLRILALGCRQERGGVQDTRSGEDVAATSSPEALLDFSPESSLPLETRLFSCVVPASPQHLNRGFTPPLLCRFSPKTEISVSLARRWNSSRTKQNFWEKKKKRKPKPKPESESSKIANPSQDVGPWAVGAARACLARCEHRSACGGGDAFLVPA